MSIRPVLSLATAACLAAGAASLGAGAAWAQTTRTANIQAGKPARIAVETALKKDCSLGQIGGIRVITTPKNGTIAIRGGNLKTPASFRCPNKDTPVQALFYEPKKNFTGSDELSYETTTPEGDKQTFVIKINVGKAGGKDVQDL